MREGKNEGLLNRRTKFLFFSFWRFALRAQFGCVEIIEIRSIALGSVSKIQASFENKDQAKGAA